jgi:hypothetical protein
MYGTCWHRLLVQLLQVDYMLIGIGLQQYISQ